MSTFKALAFLSVGLQLFGCSQPIGLPYYNEFEGTNLPDGEIYNATTIEANWTVREGVLVQRADLGSMPQQNAFDGSVHTGSSFILSGGEHLRDFEFSSKMQIKSETGDECGLVFSHQDDSNYYRLSSSMRDGFTFLQRKKAGEWTTLAKNARGSPTGQSQHVKIISGGGHIEVEQNGVLLFAVQDPSLVTGSVGFYARNHCSFENVSISPISLEPRIVLTKPHNFSVTKSKRITVSGQVLNALPDHSIETHANETLCVTPPTIPEEPAFKAVCDLPNAAPVKLVTRLLSSDNKEVSQRSLSIIIPAGLNIVTLGDSNTNGRGDAYGADGTSLSGIRVSSRGYQANLMDLMLSREEPVRSVIFNTGIVAEQSGWMLESRIEGLLEQHGDADMALLMIGTNDVLNALPSGMGCLGQGCEATYAGNLQKIVDKISGQSIEVHLAFIPPLFGDHTSGRYSDPAEHPTNELVREYNSVARTQIQGYKPGPDLYKYFLGEMDRSYLFADLYHPNGLGTSIVASLWYQNLFDPDAPLPFIVEHLRIKTGQERDAINESHGYQLNLLEKGNRFYIDEEWTLTEIPGELSGARWVMTANQDRDVVLSDYLEFDSEETPVDIYVAIPTNGETPLPNWLASWEETELTLDATLPDPVKFRTFIRRQLTGRISLPGASELGQPLANYNFVVAIVPSAG